MRLSELHRKAQLWRGIVSIALIEGRSLIPMDPNGLSDPYVKFRLGNQKYKSKVRLRATLVTVFGTRWRAPSIVWVCLHRLCRRRSVRSGGSSLTCICTRRVAACWRSPCGTETRGGGTTSSDGQSHDLLGRSPEGLGRAALRCAAS